VTSPRPARAVLAAGLVLSAALGRADVPPEGPPGSPQRGGRPLETWTAPKPAPVYFDGHVLFHVRAGVADLTPEVRAERIQARLDAIAHGGEPGPVRVEEGLFSDIYVGDQFVASITDDEAGASGAKRVAYARYVAQTIADAMKRYQAERAPKALVRSAVLAGVATAILVAFLLLLRLTRKKLGSRLERFAESALARARIQRFEILSPEVQKRLVVWVGRLLHLGLVLVALFAWLMVVGHLFPWTRDPADRSLGFVLRAVGSVGLQVVGFLPNLVYIVLFSFVGYVAHRINVAFFQGVARGAIRLPGFYPDWSAATSRLVSVFIYALVAVAIYPYLPGSGSSAFQAIGILFGAMISLGSGSSVANAISGVVLTYMRPFAVGDFVRVADTTGTVTQQSMLAVRLLTIRNESVTIPASTVLANPILNYSAQARGTGVAITTSVTIGYDTPWRKVHDLLLAAAGKTTHVQENPRPWVIQTALSDFYVRYELAVYIDDPARQHFILSELNQNVQDVFFEAGVEILSPHYAQLREGNRPAIPEEWRPKGQPRAFAVEVRDAAVPTAAPEPRGADEAKKP